MENPFELILERLDRIEKAILNLNIGIPIAEVNHPMDIKELSAYLNKSKSAIYTMTFSNKIPHYKSGLSPVVRFVPFGCSSQSSAEKASSLHSTVHSSA